jgi:hypothetical protein
VPVGLPRRDRERPGQDRARQRDDDQVAHREVPGAADDPARLGAEVDPAEPDRLRELGELLDLRHAPDRQRPGDLRPVDLLELQAHAYERLSDGLRGGGDVGDVVTQPGQGDSHYVLLRSRTRG